eukprot:g2676.t1
MLQRSLSSFFCLSAKDSGNIVCRATEAIRANGFVFVTDLFEDKDEFRRYRERLKRYSENVFRDLKNHEEGDIGIGSASGFHEICLRSKCRYDLPTWIHGCESRYSWSEEDAFPESLLFCLEEIVRSVLNEESENDNVERAFSGIVVSNPGSPDQYWHADSLHEERSHRPANVLNVLVATDSIPVLKGPTEFIPGSHIMTNHYSNERVDSNIVYQNETNTPESIGMSSGGAFTMALPARSAVIFDDRILHRGLGNMSSGDRDVAYFSYKRSGFMTDTHFEATRSLYDGNECFDGGI